MRHTRRRLDHGAALHQQPPPRPRRQRRRDRRGDRDHQRARAPDQQQRQTAIDPGGPILPEGQRRHQDHQRRQRDDRRHVDPREAVDEPLGRGARVFGVFDEADDAGDGVVAGFARHAHPQRGLGVDRAGKDRIAHAAGLRNAFAGHGAFVDAAGPLDDVAIRGDAVAGADQDHLPDRQAVGGDGACPARLLQHRGLGHQIGQRADALAGPAGGDAFQNLAHGEQEHDQRRLLGRADQQRAARGDGHQAFDREGLAHAQRRNGAPGHGRHPDQAGRDECRIPAARGRQQRHDPGQRQQQSGQHHQPPLGRPVPRRFRTRRGADRLFGRVIDRHRRRDAITQGPDDRLDLVRPGGAGVQIDAQPFGHQRDPGRADAGHPLDRAHDLGRASGAIHARDGPFPPVCRVIRHVASCHGSFRPVARKIGSLATRASRGVSCSASEN